MDKTQELVNAIKEQIELIEAEMDKTTAAAKGRCRSAANQIKNLATEVKKTHK
jgi:phage-related protein